MKKYLPIIFAILTFIITFLANYNVYLFGDDYFYVTFSQGSINDFWNHHIEHYTLINGRAIVHFLVSIFLAIPSIWWKIFNSFMLASIVYFGSKIVSKNTFWAGLVFLLGTCSIGISVSRQSIYWLTGSFNYVYPVFLLFTYWYSLLKYRESKKHFWLLCILGFLSAATVEQGGMMVFGLTLLLFIKDRITHETLDKKQILLLIITLIGVLSVILSPATFVRYELENQEKLPIIEASIQLIKYLLNSYFLTTWMLPTHIAFALLLYYKNKEHKLISALILFSIPLFIYGAYSVTTAENFGITKMLVLLYLIIVYAYGIITLIIQEWKTMKDNSMIFTIATILLFGSQLMLVVSSVYGERNLIFGIYMLFLMVAYLTENIRITPISSIFAGIFACVCIWNQITIIRGYHESYLVEKRNIEKIKNNTDQELILEVPDINYTWSMPYVSKYHEYYYKKYYKIDDAVEIIWDFEK